MYLAQLLRANPPTALALLICLTAILWCILLARRQRNRLDRSLTGLLGLIATYHALRMLKDSGVQAFAHLQTVAAWVDAASASLYLVAASILKASSSDHSATKIHLRLAEAGEKPSELSGGLFTPTPELAHPLIEASPLAMFALDAQGVVTHCNSAAEGLIGWTRAELVGHELPFHARGPVQSKDGSFVEAALWTAPVRSPNGAPRGTLIIAAGKSALHLAGLELSRPAQPRLVIDNLSGSFAEDRA